MRGTASASRGPAPRDATGGHVTAARASPAAAGPEAEEKRLRGDRGCGHRGASRGEAQLRGRVKVSRSGILSWGEK